MVNEILLRGVENARNSTDICKALGIKKRDLTATVEAERRNGYPICASTDSKNPGYFLVEGYEKRGKVYE